jgi:hypothetical protein
MRQSKEGFLALLFLVCLSNVVKAQQINVAPTANFTDDLLAEKAVSQKIYMNPEWSALLHVDHNKPYINDAHFLLSLPHFSLKNELILDLNEIQNPLSHDEFICKFPARTLWLQQQLQLAPISFTQCKDFINYLHNAPADTIKLVYVAENITQPSSMMGHVLLQISGLNKSNKYVDHAVSFYTDVSGFNAPKFMFQALVTGKKGYFSLTPLSEKLERYHHEEQRNIWTYELSLTDEQKQRIQYHIWELKTAPLTYYFKGYNCATLTHFILATTGNPAIEEDFGAILSPLDIAKSVNTAHMVENTTLSPSDSFAIRMLSGQYSQTWQKNLKKAIQNDTVAKLIKNTQSPVDRFVMYQITSHYKDFLHDQGTIKAGDNALDQQLEQSKASVSDFVIDLSQYKNPLKAPNDSQLSIGTGYDDQKHEIKLDYLPTSQKLEDDNSQSASEHELLLGNVGLKYLTQSHQLKIDYINLYSMASFIPVDVFTGGISGQMSLTYAPRFDTSLREQQSTTFEGGAGFTKEVIPNLTVSALALAGTDYMDHQILVHVTPSFTVIANERWNMKSVIQFQRIYSTEQFNSPFNAIKWIQSKRINKEYSIQMNYENYWNSERSQTAYSLMLKKIF